MVVSWRALSAPADKNGFILATHGAPRQSEVDELQGSDIMVFSRFWLFGRLNDVFPQQRRILKN